MRALVLVALAACLVDVAPLVRSQRVKTETAIPDFTVIANPEGAAGWRVDVRNNTDAIATVIWDESTFVTSMGQSAGRLVSGGTLKIDTSRAHPPTPVAPHANVTEFVVPEAFIEDEELEATFDKTLKENDGRLHQHEADILKHSRALRDERIVGGKLYVTVQGPNGKQTWAGAVSEAK